MMISPSVLLCKRLNYIKTNNLLDYENAEIILKRINNEYIKYGNNKINIIGTKLTIESVLIELKLGKFKFKKLTNLDIVNDNEYSLVILIKIYD